MNGAVCPVTAVVAATGIAGAAWAAVKSEHKPEATRFAAISALVFAGQMMNFSIQGGTSGHLLGGVLAAALLGLPFGLLSIALVLAVQCVVFSDGGLSMLGANVITMSLIGAGIGGFLAGAVGGRRPASLARLGFAAWCSVVLAAFACSVLLALSGTVPFAASAPAMLATHAMIGLGEALLTVAAFVLLAEPMAVSTKRSWIPAGAAAVVIALVLSPFASGSPDGLEWVATQLGFLHESAPTFVSPLAGYAVPGSLPDFASTGLAGLIGVAVVFALALALATAWKSRSGTSVA